MQSNIPDKIISLIDKYKDIIIGIPDVKLSPKRLEILIPLKEHSVHGRTGLHVMEKYNDEGDKIEYHYQWKIIKPKMGVKYNHISAWENEPHDTPNTPEYLITKTEPHHHHHVPGDRKQRQSNYDIRDMEKAFEFVSYYIINDVPYSSQIYSELV